MTDPTDILSDCATTYEAKNDDYGDSWRLVGDAAMSAANERDREHEELKSDEDPLPEPGGDEQISIISEDADNYDSVLEALRENAAKDQYGSR